MFDWLKKSNMSLDRKTAACIAAGLVTDSAFFRNCHYHLETDTPETLDFDSMAEVVKGLFHTLRGM